MKATVLYYSHTGRTAGYAREIAMYLWSRGLNVSLSSLSDFNIERIKDTDLLLTGCWTCGWFVVGQHPHQKWTEISRLMAKSISPHQILLFTTYKIYTGSMFRQMKKTMQIPNNLQVPELKSKTGRLTIKDRELLDRFIKNNTSH